MGPPLDRCCHLEPIGSKIFKKCEEPNILNQLLTVMKQMKGFLLHEPQNRQHKNSSIAPSGLGSYGI